MRRPDPPRQGTGGDFTIEDFTIDDDGGAASLLIGTARLFTRRISGEVAG